MNRTLLVLIAALACVAGGCPRGGGFRGDMLGRAQHFTVGVEQDDRPVAITNNEAHLRKAPFTIVVSFPAGGHTKVMVNASTRSTMADAVKAGRSASSVLAIPKQAMQENLFNAHQRIFVTDKGYNYWYYLNDNIHRFDTTEKFGGRRVCRRRVAGFSADMSEPMSPMAQFSGRALYLTFVKEHLLPTSETRGEQYAEHLRLLFD